VDTLRWTIDAAHRLEPAKQLESPNQDLRPPDDEPSLIVVHSISLPPGVFGGPHIERLFTNRLDFSADPYFGTLRSLRVSAHCCIFRDGAVTQFVPFDRRAWHAGVSSWRGRGACNDYSVGIELEGTDSDRFEEPQYLSLVGIVVALIRRYPALSEDALAGHSEIAPGRKTDPGRGFDWPGVRLRLHRSLTEVPL
jgi:AmpD protein